LGLRPIDSCDQFPNECQRIPFEVLQSLCSSIPPTGQINDGEYARVVARVKEWYRAAQKWQDDSLSITKTGSIVMRKGVKAKASAVTIVQSQEVDNVVPSIDRTKIHDILTASILSKVRNTVY
jgi:hypothetical protein